MHTHHNCMGSVQAGRRLKLSIYLELLAARSKMGHVDKVYGTVRYMQKSNLKVDGIAHGYILSALGHRGQLEVDYLPIRPAWPTQSSSVSHTTVRGLASLKVHFLLRSLLASLAPQVFARVACLLLILLHGVAQ